MLEALETLEREASVAVRDAADLRTLEDARVQFLGRKGRLTEILRGLGSLSPEDRRDTGQAANRVKATIEAALDARRVELEAVSLARESAASAVDLTLPGRHPRQGHMHVVNQAYEEILDIFQELGFQVATGPDIETDYYNFDSLNTPADHPARDSHDTFFIEPGVVLRTHTSPVQMRVMEKVGPPVAIVAPGRVYRVDYDASHSPMFNQIEGLLVDEGVTFADLKGTLMQFYERYFGEGTQVRLRPHFFPFTEPSAEMDISCTVCKGKGCRLCKQSGWLEIGGCGMVHPKVFEYARRKNPGYDYEKYTGFAFGMGVDRIAMLRHAIKSIGTVYENDLRFLEQF